MSKIFEIEKELAKWRKSKRGSRGGKKTPEHIRKQAIELLKDYSASEIQKRLGININSLKNWQRESISEPVFIALPLESGREELLSAEKFSLKISKGSCSLEGNLSLKEWQQAICLLEGLI